MEVVTANKENPENKGIQIIDLATKKAYDDRYFLWHSKKEIYAQEKACEVLGDEIIKLEVCNEEVIETIYEKNSEENQIEFLLVGGGGHEDAVQKMSYRNDSNARRQCKWVDLSEMWMEYNHNKD